MDGGGLAAEATGELGDFGGGAAFRAKHGQQLGM
jgi:hypothetical protein